VFQDGGFGGGANNSVQSGGVSASGSDSDAAYGIGQGFTFQRFKVSSFKFQGFRVLRLAFLVSLTISV
jgi:hypothetical protein